MATTGHLAIRSIESSEVNFFENSLVEILILSEFYNFSTLVWLQFFFYLHDIQVMYINIAINRIKPELIAKVWQNRVIWLLCRFKILFILIYTYIYRSLSQFSNHQHRCDFHWIRIRWVNPKIRFNALKTK